MTRTPRTGPRWAPLLLIAVLALGGLAHLGHHLADPACGDGSGPGPHPCVGCSALHGAALAADGVAARPPAPLPSPPLLVPVPAAPPAAPLAAGGPRAPPLA